MTLPGGVQMFVAEACSGMRQLTGFLALSAAVAYLCMRPAWYRIILVAAALPIALFANITRIIVTGYIMHFVNPRYAAGAYHTLEGVLLMGLGLFLLNSVCSLMDLFCEKPSPPEPGAEADDEPEAPPEAPRGGRPFLRGADGWAGGRIAGKLSLSPSEELP
jgi:exosortase/archaeosortase family protein